MFSAFICQLDCINRTTGKQRTWRIMVVSTVCLLQIGYVTFSPAYVKSNIGEIGTKFEIIFLEDLSSIMTDFALRCSMVRLYTCS